MKRVDCVRPVWTHDPSIGDLLSENGEEWARFRASAGPEGGLSD